MYRGRVVKEINKIVETEEKEEINKLKREDKEIGN